MKTGSVPRVISIRALCCLLLALLTACTPVVTPTPTLPPLATPPPTETVTPEFTSTPIPTLTPLPTDTPTLAPATATRTKAPPKPTLVLSCPGAPEIMLQADRLVQVSSEPPVSNRMRSLPGVEMELVGLIGPGEIVYAAKGPRCADGYAWWYVKTFSGLEGWTAEGDATGYWLLPLQPQASASAKNVALLTASQVTSAYSIEEAIKRATADGTRPGTVILDGRDGSFNYQGDDRSLNIFVSDLTLLGLNEARIENCGDGLFFDGFPIENIQVEGIEFVCSGHGVVASSAIRNVTLRANIFRTILEPINLGGESSNWLIEQNLLDSLSNGIEINGASNMVIRQNYISAWEGILLRQCSDFRITANRIESQRWGIHLLQESSGNLVEKNCIFYEQYSGIILLEGVRDNQILSNTVTCAGEGGCLSVDAPQAVAAVNEIAGNLP